MFRLSDESARALIRLESQMAHPPDHATIYEQAINEFNANLVVLSREIPEILELTVGPEMLLHRHTSAPATLGPTGPTSRRGMFTERESRPYGPGYLLWSQFVPRLHSAIQYARRYERDASSSKEPTSPQNILDERQKLLAQLVQAYLSHQDDFKEWAVGDDEVWLFHKAFPDGHIIPNWSHVLALARDGLLVREPEKQLGAFRIALGPQVLKGLSRSYDGREEKTDQGRRATAERIVFNVTGGSPNIAVQSSHFTQTARTEVRAGDVQSLLTALEMLGVHESHRAELESALGEEPTSSGIGARARRWFGEYLSRSVSGATGTGLYAAAEQWPSIQQAIEAFASVG